MFWNTVPNASGNKHLYIFSQNAECYKSYYKVEVYFTTYRQRFVKNL